ncbi:MAG: alpha/beta fold hydrolase [Alphaproteobacteria bacterium]|nr:alpha/beta fold hydrolase [Alphaproteobacteria bacterium]
MTPEFLALPGRRLAYHRIPGREPGVVFLGGFASDMTGTKAGFLAEKCAAAGHAFLRFDYRGHGQSAGRFEDGTIGDWFDDARETIGQLTQGPQIVVGSSMGGWIALLLARAVPERVRALVGVAAAPDFTEDLMWDVLTQEQKGELRETGRLLEPSDYSDEPMVITLRLIEEARGHLLLRGRRQVSCPLRLLQGGRDPDVPPAWPQKIVQNIEAEDARIIMIEDGDHRLNRDQDLALLWKAIEEFL